MDIHADIPDIHVRPLRRDEAELLDTVFAGLSPQSRHLRFHSPIPRLTAPVRRALLAVDGRDHVALVAVLARGEPVGIARLIRDRLRLDEAEIAFEVVDAWQRRGVGRLLLTALAERATASASGGCTPSCCPRTPPRWPCCGRCSRCASPDGTGTRPSWSACCRASTDGHHDGRHPRRPGGSEMTSTLVPRTLRGRGRRARHRPGRREHRPAGAGHRGHRRPGGRPGARRHGRGRLHLRRRRAPGRAHHAGRGRAHGARHRGADQHPAAAVLRVDPTPLPPSTAVVPLARARAADRPDLPDGHRPRRPGRTGPVPPLLVVRGRAAARVLGGDGGAGQRARPAAARGAAAGRRRGRGAGRDAGAAR